jgi:osmotically-inducible protein OsmY
MRKLAFLVGAFSLSSLIAFATSPNGAMNAPQKNPSYNQNYDMMMGEDDEMFENEADRGLSQRVREALLADNSLPSAKNISIRSKDGKVILRGYVANSDEKNAIVKRVKSMSGVSKVDDQLEVANR